MCVEENEKEQKNKARSEKVGNLPVSGKCLSGRSSVVLGRSATSGRSDLIMPGKQVGMGSAAVLEQ